MQLVGRSEGVNNLRRWIEGGEDASSARSRTFVTFVLRIYWGFVCLLRCHNKNYDCHHRDLLVENALHII